MDMGMIMTVVAMVVVVVTALLVLPPARQLLQKKTSDAEYRVLLELAETGVRWARQWMQTSTGSQKKEKVAEYLKEKAAVLGLTVDENDIDKAIEAVYDRIKQEIAKEENRL